MCDTLVALCDDGVLFAKNSDRDPNECQLLEWIDAADHLVGETVSCTYVEIPQVAHTHAALVSRPWWMWGAEMGANEHGVVIGNEAVFTRDSRRRGNDRALLGMDLLRLALERATDAEGAVDVIVELLERHGQGGPCSHERPGFTYDNSYLVADPDGAYVLETAGRRWATEQVRGRGRTISNELTIPGFARAHGERMHTWVAAGADRRRQTEPLACAARGPADLMRALRSHGSTDGPRWSPVHGGLGAPCVHAGGILASSQTTASWVADLRDRPRHWATGTAAPCTSIFKPVLVDRPGDANPDATDRFDPGSPWWRHELLHRTVIRDAAHLLPVFRDARDRLEAAWLADPPDPGDAFEEAGHLEAGWLDELRRSHPHDRRPGWVRRSWHSIDAAAGIGTELTG